MKVAVVIGDLSWRCGPSVNGVRLLRGLQSEGVKAWLLHQTPVGTVDKALEADLGPSALGLAHTHPLQPRLAVSFLRRIREIRPDIVHFNLPTHTLALAPVARLARVRVIHTVRNLISYNAAWIQRGLRLVGPSCVDRFVAVSDAVRSSVVEHQLTPMPVETIHNGVEAPSGEDITRWRLETQQELGIEENDMVVGTAGRLSQDKHQVSLLQSLLLLRSRGLAFRFLVVGDGERRAELEVFCREQGLSEVTFLGWRKGIYRYLAAMDIFAFHSMPGAEGLPTVVIEAAMCGRPLVVADIPCLREVFEDNGNALFVPPDTPEAFAESLGVLIGSSERRIALGVAARARVVERFSAEAMVRAYLRLYRSVLGETQR